MVIFLCKGIVHKQKKPLKRVAFFVFSELESIQKPNKNRIPSAIQLNIAPYGTSRAVRIMYESAINSITIKSQLIPGIPPEINNIET